MSVDQLVDAIGKINPKYVEEAEKEQNFAESSVWAEKKRHSGWKKQHTLWLSLAACFGLLLLAGTTRILYINLAPGADSAADTCYEESAGASDMAAESAAEEQMAEDAGSTENVDDLALEKIVINEWKEVASTQVGNMSTEINAKTVSADELEVYYGVKIFPKQLPEDLAMNAETQEDYYLYYDNTDNLVADENELFYQSKDGLRSLQITVSKLTGETDFADWEVSVIGGQEVVLLHWQGSQEEECYQAIYENAGVYFKVDSTNLTEAEMLGIVRDLLKDE